MAFSDPPWEEIEPRLPAPPSRCAWKLVSELEPGDLVVELDRRGTSREPVAARQGILVQNAPLMHLYQRKGLEPEGVPGWGWWVRWEDDQQDIFEGAFFHFPPTDVQNELCRQKGLPRGTIFTLVEVALVPA